MNRLLEAARRKRSPLCTVTNAMRLVNSSGDGLPGLILDQYDRHFSAQVFDPQWFGRIGEVSGFLKENFKPRYLIIKDRTHTGSSNPEAIRTTALIDEAGPKTIVEEYGLKFGVDLNDGLNTGLFLDMRRNRRAMGELSRHKRVLNCFAYTCSFGVHARANGAQEAVNVDISKKVLERGRENYALNAITPSASEFIRGEAAAYMQRAVKKANRFDVVIIDPPSFARADRGIFQAKRDLPALLKDAVTILNPGGTLFVAVNFNAISHADLERMVKNAGEGRMIKNMERWGQDMDFPGTNTFKESYLAVLTARFP